MQHVLMLTVLIVADTASGGTTIHSERVYYDTQQQCDVFAKNVAENITKNMDDSRFTVSASCTDYEVKK